MTLKARHAAKGDVVLKPSNLISIVDFKEMYITALKGNGKGLSSGNIRMFAMGKELKDDLFLYSYDILNESTV
jgi:hypothetical protein